MLDEPDGQTSTDYFHPSCRILVVASDEATALSLIHQIVTFKSGLTQKSKAELSDEIDLEEGTAVPWIIDNKYYTAQVHFLAKVPSLPPAKAIWPPENEEEKVPAIIFAFNDGEPYQLRFASVKEGVDAHEAEITIAIRVASGPGEEPDDEDADSSKETADDFFSSHGFEFVDLTDVPAASDSEPYEIEGIPRLTSALSTIMWPSLVRKHRTAKRHPVAPSVDLVSNAAPTLLSSSSGAEYPTVESDNHVRSLFDSAEGGIADNELQALEAWLDGDANAPWIMGEESASLSLGQAEQTAGFDDDFADFVSAPGTIADAALESTWNALDDQDSLPTQDEVTAAAHRIFGARAPTATQVESSGLDHGDNPPGAPDENEEPFRFDLNEVLGALQSLKEEVSGIQDPDARRRAAATVALGFAAGLGLPSDPDNLP